MTTRPPRPYPACCGLALVLAAGAPARAADGPCDDPPHNRYDRWQGAQTCYHDAARKKRASVTIYADGKEVGPRREWRDDGSLERVYHFSANVGAYATEELYYETGDVRRVSFKAQGSEVTIEYAVSGRIHHLACLPGAAGGYAYTIKECQPKVAFDLSSWRPER